MDGHGFKALIWFTIFSAELLKSIFPFSFDIFLQNVAKESFWGIGQRMLFAMSLRTKGSITAAISESFFEREAWVSDWSIGTLFITKIPP